jgi:integrase
VDPLRAIIEKRIETIAAENEPNPHGLLWTADPKKDKHGRVLPLDGSPIDPRNDLAAWHAVLERAGALKVPLHGARHTAASLLLEANVPEPIIMKILGHSSYAVSMGYMNVDRRLLAEAMSSMSARMIEAKPPQ